MNRLYGKIAARLFNVLHNVYEKACEGVLSYFGLQILTLRGDDCWANFLTMLVRFLRALPSFTT